MIRAAGQLGWLDEERAMLEALTGIRRAGADIIITYFAKDAARLIEQGRA
jgi:porphobilinogen synthase